MRRLLVVLLCFVFSAACTSGAGPVSSSPTTVPTANGESQSSTVDLGPTSGSTLVIGVDTLGSEIWDVAQQSYAEKGVLDMVGDTLLRHNSETREVRPGLVESWHLSDDGLTWTFQLREGVQFNEGWGELTAEDVEFTWERVIAEDALALGATTLRNAVGGDMANFEIISPYEFAIHSPEPSVTLPFDLAHGSGQSITIQSKAYFEEVGDEEAIAHPVGTGPFEFVAHTPGQQVELKAVTSHWRQSPNFDNILVRIFPEPASLLAAAQAGDVDLATLSAQFKPEAEAAGLTVHAVPGSGNGFLVFGGMYPGHPNYDAEAPWIQESDPEAGRLVREALTLAIDREGIVDQVLQGQGELSAAPYGFAPGPFQFNDESWEPPTYDPAQAQMLLAEAGYPDGFSVTMPIFALSGRPETELMGHAVADMLEQIGITVDRQPMEYRPTFRALMEARDTAGMLYIIANSFYDEPVQYFSAAGSEAATLAIVHDPVIEDTIEELVNVFDTEERMEIQRALGDYVIEGRLAAPIAAISTTVVTSDKVAGVDFVSGAVYLNQIEYVQRAQ